MHYNTEEKCSVSNAPIVRRELIHDATEKNCADNNAQQLRIENRTERVFVPTQWLDIEIDSLSLFEEAHSN